MPGAAIVTELRGNFIGIPSRMMVVPWPRGAYAKAALYKTGNIQAEIGDLHGRTFRKFLHVVRRALIAPG